MQSTLFTWNYKDFLKALLVAFLTAFVAVIGQAITTTPPFVNITWIEVILALKAGAGASIAYLIKNFFTDTNAQAASTLTTAATTAGQPIVIEPKPAADIAAVTPLKP